MKYEIEEKILNSVLQYLAQKPYLEVRDLINALQRSVPIEEKQGE